MPILAVLFLVLVTIAHAQRATAPPTLTPAAVEDGIAVFFSPKGGCADAVVQAIDSAKRTLNAQAYSFTSKEIASAIGRAHERGVKVRAVLDDSNKTGKYSGATYLANKGVPVWIDAKHAIAHNKAMIIDEANVITGSFNFTEAAEKSNAENPVIITGRPKVAGAYAHNFQEHLEHAERFKVTGE
jgi:phosphatidylserine/phosphatidylglycerophosphate/cardiolipin synthase-like enzyme